MDEIIFVKDKKGENVDYELAVANMEMGPFVRANDSIVPDVEGWEPDEDFPQRLYDKYCELHLTIYGKEFKF